MHDRLAPPIRCCRARMSSKEVSPEEAVFKDLGIPLIGAVLGAMMGWMFDCNMDHDQAIRSHSDERESDGFEEGEG